MYVFLLFILNKKTNIMNSEKVSNHISNWIKDYANGVGIKTLVVGVSGGIDSAVVSTLSAMTGINTILVEMPIGKEYNPGNGHDHIKWLESKYDNVNHEIINLTNPFNSYKEELSLQTNLPNSKNYELCLANTASRLRMISLYSYSNCHGGLVIGTGNKVEDFGVGFFTLGGDGQVDISPIADLMKSEVYELGKFLGVNEHILKARPTDGLWDDGRTDEDQVGATYDELEWAMNFVEKNWYWETGMENEGFLDYNFDTDCSKINGKKVNLSNREKTVLKIYLDRHNANKHKMVPIPVCRIPEELK
jgi:NAD+ synthase